MHLVSIEHGNHTHINALARYSQTREAGRQNMEGGGEGRERRLHAHEHERMVGKARYNLNLSLRAQEHGEHEQTELRDE